MPRGNNRLLAFILFCGLGSASAQAGEILPDESYDFTLEGGETIRNARVKSTDPKTVFVRVEGAFEPLKIPRSEISKALLLPRAKKIREYELRILGGLGISAGDLKLLSSSFPQFSVGVTAFLSRRLPYVGISALTASLEYAHISDGERVFSASSIVLIPQWRWRSGQFEWFLGVGGGVTGLYLVSYNFTKFRPNAYAIFEMGAAYRVTPRIRIYVVSRAGWWPDSAGLLVSYGGHAGISYAW